jgi:hypothetical protein
MLNPVIDKLIWALISTVILLAVSNPMSYKLGDMLVGKISKSGVIANNGCPTVLGHLIYAIIFFILIYAVMLIFNAFKSTGLQTSVLILLKYAFFSTLVFFIMTNTEIYKLIGNVTKNKTADANGCPTIIGLFVNALLFFVIYFAIMFFPQETCSSPSPVTTVIHKEPTKKA